MEYLHSGPHAPTSIRVFKQRKTQTLFDRRDYPVSGDNAARRATELALRVVVVEVEIVEVVEARW